MEHCVLLRINEQFQWQDPHYVIRVMLLPSIVSVNAPHAIIIFFRMHGCHEIYL